MPWYLPDRNPVFWEETRRRLRGGRGFLLLFAYVLLLIVGLLIATFLMAQGGGSDPRQWATFGHRLWLFFMIGQGIMLTLISPGLTASAISAERERHTLELLFITPLPTRTLALGKFLGAISQLLLVLLAGMPVVSVVFLYGGVSPLEVVEGYALLLATGLFYAAVGYLASCLCARLTPAIAWAYGLMLFMIIGVPAGLLLFILLFRDSMGTIGDWVIHLLDPTVNYYLLTVGSPDTGADRALLIKILLLLGETGVLLLACHGLLQRLRGAAAFRRVTPAIARYLSHTNAPE